MTHYAQVFTIDRYRIPAHLGYYDAERGTKQTVEVSMRLYFPKPPECVRTDRAPFIDYGELVAAVKDRIAGGEFRLIEHLAGELFRIVREVLDTHALTDIRLWLKLTKCTTPIAGLEGGASYVLSDLPADATFPPGA